MSSEKIIADHEFKPGKFDCCGEGPAHKYCLTCCACEEPSCSGFLQHPSAASAESGA